jgi:hypothetical protein
MIDPARVAARAKGDRVLARKLERLERQVHRFDDAPDLFALPHNAD